MLSITARADIDAIIQTEEYTELIIESIECLVHFCTEQEFQDYLIAQSRSLIVGVSLNLMRTRESELQDMISDPESFVNLGLDTCDKQKSKVPKTQGAKLLEALCDNVDGAVSFLTLFCCQSINLAFGQEGTIAAI